MHLTCPRVRHHRVPVCDSPSALPGHVCTLEDAEVDRYLNTSSRTWLVQENDIGRLRNDLQRVIDCTTPGDYVLLNATGTVQLQGRVVVPWNLTVGGYVALTDMTGGGFPEAAKKTVMTCPRENKGIFLVR